MKARLFVTFLALCASSLTAQAPASAPAALVHTNDLGFSYSLPSDWDVKDMAPALPLVHQQLENSATSEIEKNGAACVQIPLMASHGAPSSVVEALTLAFDCFGQRFTDKDLPAFAVGVAGGLKKSLNITDPIYGAYTLGTHSIWIERATGTLIAHPEAKYTVETVCSILNKGAVCWTAMARDGAALKIFEHGAVTLDGETYAALVPATALDKKPSQSDCAKPVPTPVEPAPAPQ
jgi:hypothetical protein